MDGDDGWDGDGRMMVRWMGEWGVGPKVWEWMYSPLPIRLFHQIRFWT